MKKTPKNRKQIQKWCILLFQILRFLISKYKYTFRSCTFDLNCVNALNNLAFYFVLNMKIYIALCIGLQSLELCSPNQEINTK